MLLREKLTNIILGALAAWVLADTIVLRPANSATYLFSMGTLGALVLRAISDETQPIVIVCFGTVLASLAIFENHGLNPTRSDFLFVVWLLVALAYARWEGFRNWLSL